MPVLLSVVLFAFVFLGTFPLSAQIVDVLDDANSQIDEGWNARGDLEYERQQDQSSYSLLSATATQAYRQGSDIYLLVLSREYGEQNRVIFSNASFVHGRYRRLLSKSWEWEVFVQYQRKPTRRLRGRNLIGTGPKLNLASEKRWKVSLGLALMHETEDYEPGSTEEEQRNHRRFSLALQVSYQFNEQVGLRSAGYIQPRANHWGKRRLTNITSFEIAMSSQLSFLTTLTTAEDRDAPPDVQRYQSKLTQGISYQLP